MCPGSISTSSLPVAPSSISRAASLPISNMREPKRSLTRALMSTAMIDGYTIFGRSVEVRNAAGDLLLVLPFTAAVRASD